VAFSNQCFLLVIWAEAPVSYCHRSGWWGIVNCISLVSVLVTAMNSSLLEFSSSALFAIFFISVSRFLVKHSSSVYPFPAYVLTS
jgi:hypothetical protein